MAVWICLPPADFPCILGEVPSRLSTRSSLNDSAWDPQAHAAYLPRLKGVAYYIVSIVEGIQRMVLMWFFAYLSPLCRPQGSEFRGPQLHLHAFSPWVWLWWKPSLPVPGTNLFSTAL
jgi:hypothetical protein